MVRQHLTFLTKKSCQLPCFPCQDFYLEYAVWDYRGVQPILQRADAQDGATAVRAIRMVEWVDATARVNVVEGGGARRANLCCRYL